MRNPYCFDAIAALRNLYRKSNRMDDAVQAAIKCVGLRPKNIGNYLVLAELSSLNGDTEGAKNCLTHALALNLHDPRPYLAMAEILQQEGELDKAIDYLSAATEAFPDDLNVRKSFARSLLRSGRLKEAAHEFGLCLKQFPESAELLNDLGEAFAKMGDIAQAESSYRKAIDTDPQYHRAHWNLSLLLLLTGRLGEGWKEYEHGRLAGFRRNEHEDIPEWTGEPLHNKRILLYGDQGLKEEILFSSCLHQFMNLATDIALQCHPGLFPLLQRSFPSLEVLPRQNDDTSLSRSDYDYAFPLGSLPLLLRQTEDDFPAREAYLQPDPDLIHKIFSASYKKSRLRIGISWKQEEETDENARYSLPIEAWGSIFNHPDAQVFSLQYGDQNNDTALFKEQFGQVPIRIPNLDYNDPEVLASLISSMDIVISVDNPILHLAGALGKTSLGLLPAMPDWPWQLKRPDSPWYPSVRLFRQDPSEGWRPVIADVQDALEAFTIYLADKASLGKLLQAECHEQALPLAEKLCHSIFVDTDCLFSAGLVYAEAERYDTARGIFEKCLQRQPFRSDIHFNLGKVFKELLQPDRAEQAYNRAIALDQKQDLYFYNLANLCHNGFQLEKAEYNFLRAIELKEDKRYFNNLATLYKDACQIKRAVDTYHQALEIDPDYQAPLSNILLCLHYDHFDKSEIFHSHLDWEAQHGGRERWLTQEYDWCYAPQGSEGPG
ncbi:MAG: tetratricopeptide repeat protein, partial [Gammaproteobacteria bacterium]